MENLNWSDALGQIITGFLTWIIVRAKSKIDAFFEDIDARKKEISALHEELGKLKMINEAQWRNIEDLKNSVKNLKNL